jgi:ABC-type sugar transport system permease subunit
MTQLISADSTSTIDVTEIIIFRMIENYSPFLADMLASIFNNFTLILWFTGIPIILFMNGLQKINTQMFEAAQIDGANSWQILWKITIPNIKSTALVVAIFSVVQIAIFEVNPIYQFVVNTIRDNYASGLGFAAAVVLVYSFIVLIFVGIAFFLLKERDHEIYEESLRERQKRNLEKMQKMQKRQNEETFKDGMKRIWNQTKTIFKKKEVAPHDSEA